MKQAIDHYSVLNLNKSASMLEIYNAYSKMLEFKHPIEVTKNIQEAYAVLGKKESREAYDNQISTAAENSGKLFQVGESWSVGKSWTFLDSPESMEIFGSRGSQEFDLCTDFSVETPFIGEIETEQRYHTFESIFKLDEDQVIVQNLSKYRSKSPSSVKNFV
eukprot:NODE_229_length_13800_cov_0.838114.p9 type:complete len:162 gc:universal NODE_229_length_13800_cov_0.838114:5017-5502(+)